jgi:hypothetical protein
MIPKIIVSKDSTNKVTRCGGSAPLVQYLQHGLQMPQRFEQITLKQGANAVFSISDKFMSILTMTMLCCPRLAHINPLFKDEELLARQLGLPRIFDQSSAHKLFRQCDGWTVRQLERISAGLVREKGGFEGLRRLVVDVDASQLHQATHTKEGARPDFKGHGKDSFQISCAFANGQIVTSTFNPGNLHCSNGLMELLRETRRICGCIDCLRLDAGYLSKERLREIRSFKVAEGSEKTIDFAIAVPANADGVKKVKQYAQEHPEKWKLCPPKNKDKEGEEKIFIMNFKEIQLFAGDPESVVRMVLVKTVQKVKTVRKHRLSHRTKTRIYAIITSLGRGYSAAKVFRFYHQRQTIEHMYCELKNDFSVGKLPSTKLNANKAYFLICCLAYNCSHYFKRDTMPKSWVNKRMMTIRLCLLNIKATYHSAWEIVFDNNFRMFHIIKHIVTQLQRIIAEQIPILSSA